ncbi:hypothetical protein GCM10007304_14200 [Rhodococcoides trifolii]|uniref:TrbL/VirB6 plasmid conjugal transfer protein n=1 Tax=Rhodococcoides trifolii TaxID=908250 RepID=A0A917CXR9_9NOCA|nr:hypothetical protein [Rhodococcus trifolii]GGG01362.1 hypothetical protein GCM10007304_14200 [Rhodococcus trifolii]
MSWWDTISNGARCATGANLTACRDAAGAIADRAGQALAAPAISAASGTFEKFAEWIGQAAGDILTSSMTWWISTDSINIEPAGLLSQARPIQVVITFILMAGVLCTSLLLAITRRGAPLVEMLSGAVKYMVISSLALLVLSQALSAGDAAANALVSDGAKNFGPDVSKMLGITAINNPAMLALIALIVWVLSLIQWVFGFIRQGGIIVLAAMISIAAAGQLFPWGRQWFPRIASSLIALVLYKPMAAMIYTLGFTLVGNETTGNQVQSVIVGTMVLCIAVIALPAMMKFFSWVGGSAVAGGSSGALAAGLASVALGGSDLLRESTQSGSTDSGTTHSSDPMSSYMENNGPGTGPSDIDPGPGGHNLPDGQPWESPNAAAKPAEWDKSENPSSTGGDGNAASGVGAQDAENVGAAAATGSAGTTAAAGAATGGAALAAEAAVTAIHTAGRAVHDAGESAAATMRGDDTEGPATS